MLQLSSEDPTVVKDIKMILHYRSQFFSDKTSIASVNFWNLTRYVLTIITSIFLCKDWNMHVIISTTLFVILHLTDSFQTKK